MPQRPPIRLVVTDLDDTLLTPDKTISDEAVHTIASLSAHNVRFTFITGRPPAAIERFAQRVPTSAPLVCCNGAMLTENGRTLLKQTFPLTLVRPIMRQAVSGGLTVLLFDGETEYALSETDWSRTREANGRKIPLLSPAQQEQARDAVKVTIMTGTQTDAFLGLLPQLEAISGQISLSQYGHTGCEIVAKDVSKATGLATLCQTLGISLENVLAIGDNANDIHMLQAAGTSAAVANATDAAKAAADYICAAPYTDGVLEAIRKYIL